MTWNDLVKDLSNQELLWKKVFDKVENDSKKLTQETEKAINDNVEKSFQLFLDENKDSIPKLDDNAKQKRFNDRLDGQVSRILNEEKIKEIKVVNSDIESNLKSLEFELELANLQENIHQAREDNSNTVNLKDWIIIEGILSDQVTTEKLNSLITKIKSTNFTDREYIIDCLNSWTKEDVRKIQYLLIWNKNSYQKWVWWNKQWDISRYWTDAIFGSETYAALDKYINDKKIDGTNPDAEPALSWTDWSTSNTDVVVNPDWSVTTTTETSTYASEYGEIASVWVEIYWKQNKFDCKLDESINITDKSKKFPAGSQLEIIPNYDNNNVVLQDGILKYNSDFAGEDNFTVIVKDKDWQEIYKNNIIIKIEWDVLENNDRPQSVEKQIDKILNEINNISNFVEQRTYVEDKIDKIRIEYKDIIKKLDDINLKEEERELLTDRIVEIEKIMKVLIVKESEIHLKEYLNRDNYRLEEKLNDKCDYYFEGEYISKEKFMRKLENGKINLEQVRFVNLNVDLTNYPGDEMAEITAYLDDPDGDKRNYKITDLILTDDPYLGIGKGLTKDQEIQYKSDIYVTKIEEKSEIDKEKQALKRILWIKGLFGLGWVDEDMSIATEDYNTNNPSIMERRNLRQLKNILWDCYKDENMTVQQKFKDVARNYDLSIPPRPSQDADKNSQKLYEMYKMYKEDQNCGDYFKKVMWLFENYFVRWIDNFDVVSGKNSENDKSSLFTSIYKQEAIWRTEGLIDPDKRRQAIKSIFKAWYDDTFKLWVAFKESDELSRLEKLVKKIDLSTYLTDPNANKKHTEFTELYDTYKESRVNGTLDSKGHFVVKWEAKSSKGEDLYYNAVFDLLVWMVEWRQDVVSGVNGMRIMNMLDTQIDQNEKDLYDDEKEKQFVMLLADFNEDGRVDTGDRWLIMWLTVKNMYKSAKVDQKYLEVGNNTAPWQNVIEFAIWYMEQNGDVGLLSDLKWLQWKGLDDILKEMKTNPGLLNYLQNILANSSMPIDYIYKYGKNASAEYFNFVMPQIENGNFRIEWLEEKFQDEYKVLVEQWLVDDPEIKAILKPMFYAWVLQNWWVIYGAGGVGIALDAGKAGTFTMNLWYGEVPGVWSEGQAESVLGVVFSYGNSVELSKNTDLNLGVWVWATHKNLFVPMAYGSVWTKTRLNPNVNLDGLKAKSAHYFGDGANINVSLNPANFIWWWVSVWWSRDKMWLLDEQSMQIKESLTSKTWVLYKSLVGIDLTKDKENVISSIAQNLAEHFHGEALNDLSDADKLQINTAASNLYRWLSYYTIGLKDLWWRLTEDDPRLTQIIHDISESYVINWKNDAKKDASGLYVSGVGVSVQLLAGYVPIVSVVEFTNYKNIYSTETNQSHANYYERLVTGKWMNFVRNEEFYDKEWRITKHAVDYMNAKFSIAHPDVSVPDLDIKLMPDEDGSFAWDITPALYIPKDLIQYANINIDSKVADYTTVMDINGVEYIVVSSNTKIALMDYSRLNSARFHLFIWDNKAKEDDIKVWYDMVDFGWSPQSYEWEPESINVSLKSVNTKVTEINTELDASKYKDTNPFPIKECTKIENKEATFELKEWFGKNCVDIGGDDSILSIEWDSLTIPHTGRLTIIKMDDGKHYMYYKSQPGDQLVIDYQLESYTNTNITQTTTENNRNTIINSTTTEIVGGTKVNWANTNIEFGDFFVENNELDKIFEDIEDDLSKMDSESDRGSGSYGAFMNAAFEAWIDAVVDEDNYKIAFEKLKILLDNKLSNPMFNDLKSKIDDSNLSSQDKLMIVDRFKAIFSYHIDLTLWANEVAYLNSLVAKRGYEYEKLKWYDQTTDFPLKEKSYREKVLNQLKDKEILSRVPEKNLFGMTAFYRLWKLQEWRSYSMTQMWSTNVLGGYMENIATEDLASTQNWFLNNLDKSGLHKQIIKDSLQKQISIPNLKLTDDQLKDLLSWKNIDIDKWNTKIKLDIDYVFYLLWECANESIWINLKSVTISNKTENPDDPHYHITPPDIDTDNDSETDVSIEEISGGGRWVRVSGGEKTYSSRIYTDSVGSNAEIDYARQNKVDVWAGYVIGSKPGSEIDNQYTEDETDNQYTEDDNQSTDP